MQRMKMLSLLGGMGLFFGACSSGDSTQNPTPDSSNGPFLAEPLTRHPTNQPLTLLSRYVVVNENNGRLSASYGGLRYWPRQANHNRNPNNPNQASGPRFTQYSGWDILDAPGSNSNRSDWLRLTLTRDTTVVVAWENSALWLSGWRRGETTAADGKKFNTYTRTFRAGEITLGSPEGKGEYWVLLAEGSGQPSAEPALPSGITERPVPNTTCPAWMDGLWQAKGPDGEIYQSWHPQIDPVYWCYYRHDHNSDPGLIGYQAPFLYTARYTNNQAERAEGFKGFAVRDGDIGWYINIHAETGTDQRVCARFHTVVVVATRWRTGEKLVELYYKGDFGSARSNQGSNPFYTNICTDPRTGQEMSQEAIGRQLDQATGASRRIRPSGQVGGYEQWDGGLTRALMQFNGAGIGIDIQNPATSCNGINCTSLVTNGGNSSTRRTINFNNIRVRYDPAKDPDRDGWFETNLYGDGPYIPNDYSSGIGPLRQYIKPGTDISLSGGFATEDAWRGLYVRGGNTQDLELEGALGTVN